jgi:hypothetical protein
MTHRIKFAVLACTMVMAASCANSALAATSLCPTGTRTASLIQDSETPDAPLEFPPDEGAYGETPVQKWDISAASGDFKVQCNPNEVGFDGQTTHLVPGKPKACQFDTRTGAFTCQ